MGKFITREKFLTGKWFKAYGLIILGSFLIAGGYIYFINPHKLVPGGIYGISIVIHHLFNFPIGITSLAFNIPLTIIGIKVLGPRFGAKTVTGFVLTSVFVDLMYMLNKEQIALTGDDVLLSAVFGGVTIGIGVGLVFKAKASSGGSDAIAMMISKVTKLPVGQVMMGVDAIIVFIGLAAFRDWKMPFYAWITIFIMGKMIDVVLHGMSYDKTVMIISNKYEEIRQKIITDLNRGGTLIEGKGMYNGEERKIIYTVVNRREVAILEEHISKIDPDAFMTVTDANEILGKGFKSLNEKLGT
jgi:uncharacterized membrane-anchored protein YitT (DUF2179 family)